MTKLLFLDLETTGLDPNKSMILEVAAYVSDLARPFEREGAIVHAVLPLLPSQVEGFDPFIVNMHTKNGLLEECLERGRTIFGPTFGTITAAERQAIEDRLPFTSAHRDLRSIEDRLLALIPLKKDVDRENVTTLAGSSVHFDLGFLRVHMPRLAENLSHRVYDVSAVHLFCRSLGMPRLPPEEAHRALPDVEESVRRARLCAEWLRYWPEGTLREKPEGQGSP